MELNLLASLKRSLTKAAFDRAEFFAKSRLQIAMISFIISLCSATTICWAASPPRRMLVFSIDQATPNGPIRNQDMLAISRVAKSLNMFRSKYDIYALLPADYSNPTLLNTVLTELSAANVPFILDVYSSDIMMEPWGNKAFDLSHGEAASLGQLKAIRTKFGKYFAGVRVFEVFAQNAGIIAALSGHQPATSWFNRIRHRLPSDDFYQKAILEKYFSFASKNKMFLIFSDWYWEALEPNPPDPSSLHQAQNESGLRELITKYPNVGIVVYANNAPNAPFWEGNWETIVKPFTPPNAASYGLSDQSWICKGEKAELHCPPQTLITWAKDALAKEARLVQFEPYYYWWHFPWMDLTHNDYPTSKDRQLFGCPRKALLELAAALSVQTDNVEPACRKAATLH